MKKEQTMWSKINNTTWYKKNSWTGENYVFYEDNKGNKKCLHQLLGSGVYATSSNFIKISFLEDFTLKDNTLISKKAIKDILTKIADTPKIYDRFGMLDIESVKKDTNVIPNLVSLDKQNNVQPKNKEKIILPNWVKDHPNKKQMEFFLNNYPYELIQNDVKFSHWKNYNPNDYRCLFTNKENNIKITLLFAQNQKNAIEVGRTNFDGTLSKWIINGSVLIVITANDENIVNETLSYFSGEE